jgi:hypothetical protein
MVLREIQMRGRGEIFREKQQIRWKCFPSTVGKRIYFHSLGDCLYCFVYALRMLCRFQANVKLIKYVRKLKSHSLWVRAMRRVVLRDA